MKVLLSFFWVSVFFLSLTAQVRVPLSRGQSKLPDVKQLKEVKEIVDVHLQLTLKNVQIIQDKELKDYLDSIVSKLLLSSPKRFSKNAYSIVVVSDQGFGARAYLNGYILIDLAFICDIDYIDILALVLIHEINHIGFHHAYYQFMLERRQERILTWAFPPAYNLSDFLKVKNRLERQYRILQLRHEVEADLLAAKVMVSAGYKIEDSEQLLKSTSSSEIHSKPKPRTNAIMREMNQWLKSCKNCQPKVHPRTEWLQQKCVSYGLL